MPAFVNHNASLGIPHTPAAKSITSYKENTPIFEEKNFTITGVTKDSSGVALGSCTVKLFLTASDVLSQSTISDASGNYSFIVDKTVSYYVVAYLDGGTPVAGTTINTLAGT